METIIEFLAAKLSSMQSFIESSSLLTGIVVTVVGGVIVAIILYPWEQRRANRESRKAESRKANYNKEDRAQRLMLCLKFSDDSFALTQSSINRLRRYYKKKRAGKPAKCEASLKVRNERAAIAYIGNRFDDEDPQHALKDAEQSYLMRKKDWLSHIEEATTLLLNHDGIYWLSINSRFEAQANSSYIDEDGIVQSLAPVSLWVTVIEEMARGLLFNRAEKYANDGKHFPIDVIWSGKNPGEEWYFTCYLEKRDFDDDPHDLSDIIARGPSSNIFDLPEASRIRLLPDCYLGLARFRSRNPEQFQKNFGADCHLVDLSTWSIGPH